MTPELAARTDIDAQLVAAGWTVQDHREANLGSGRGGAVREFPLKRGHGAADYLLFVDRKPVGIVEAKKEGETLTGVEVQTEKYSAGLPDLLKPPVRPLPFLYQSTGVETRLPNALDPELASRDVFAFHRPETLADWLQTKPSHEAGVSQRPWMRTMSRGLRAVGVASGSGWSVGFITSRFSTVRPFSKGRIVEIVPSIPRMRSGSSRR